PPDPRRHQAPRHCPRSRTARNGDSQVSKTTTSTTTSPNAGASMGELPVVVIGAGPVGLATAAHLLERDLTPLVLEAGPAIGAAIRMWGHTSLFSPWRYNIDAAAGRLLEPTGGQEPGRAGLTTEHDRAAGSR